MGRSSLLMFTLPSCNIIMYQARPRDQSQHYTPSCALFDSDRAQSKGDKARETAFWKWIKNVDKKSSKPACSEPFYFKSKF